MLESVSCKGRRDGSCSAGTARLPCCSREKHNSCGAHKAIYLSISAQMKLSIAFRTRELVLNLLRPPRRCAGGKCADAKIAECEAGARPQGAGNSGTTTVAEDGKVRTLNWNMLWPLPSALSSMSPLETMSPGDGSCGVRQQAGLAQGSDVPNWIVSRRQTSGAAAGAMLTSGLRLPGRLLQSRVCCNLARGFGDCVSSLNV